MVKWKQTLSTLASVVIELVISKPEVPWHQLSSSWLFSKMESSYKLHELAEKI